MKKIISLLLLAIAISFYFKYIYSKNKLSTQNFQHSTFSSPSPISYMSPTVTWNDITYGYEYFEVTDLSKLILIDNFTQKISSEKLLEENNCQYTINGGFYDTNNQPLGLFINGAFQTKAIDNALVNGFLSITNTPEISYTLPKEPILALQTGPILFDKNKPVKLTIRNDEYARRMVAAISSKATLLFITFFIPETKIQGPKLQDLPEILEKINLDIITAINLDGGNASMFQNKNVSIQEIASIGSLFCLRK